MQQTTKTLLPTGESVVVREGKINAREEEEMEMQQTTKKAHVRKATDAWWTDEVLCWRTNGAPTGSLPTVSTSILTTTVVKQDAGAEFMLLLITPHNVRSLSPG